MKSILNRETIKSKLESDESKAWESYRNDYYEARKELREQKERVNNFKKYHKMTPKNLETLKSLCNALRIRRMSATNLKHLTNQHAIKAFMPVMSDRVFKPAYTFLMNKSEAACLIVSLMNAYNHFNTLGPNAKLALQLDHSKLKVDIRKGDEDGNKN